MTDLFTGDPTPGACDTLGVDREGGTRFTVSEPVDIDKIAWYRCAVGVLERPQVLRIWLELGGGLGDVLATVPIIEDAGTVGWHVSPLGTTLTLDPAEVYYVSGQYEAGAAIAYFNAGQTGSPPVPFLWSGNKGGSTASGYGFHTTQYADNPWAITPVAVEGSWGGSDPGGDAVAPVNENISGRLEEWLSSHQAQNIHEGDGLPWLTKLLLDGVDVGVREVKELIDALAGAGTAVLWGNPLEKMAAIANVLQAIHIQTDAGPPRMETSILDTIASEALGLSNQIDTLPTDARSGQDVFPLPGAGWTLVDTEIGQGAFAWDQPADRYVLTITAYAPTRPYVEVGGVPYWLHRGFWAVLNFDKVGHYYPIVGHKHELYVVGQRLPGVLLGLDGDLEWTLQAYDYTG